MSPEASLPIVAGLVADLPFLGQTAAQAVVAGLAADQPLRQMLARVGRQHVAEHESTQISCHRGRRGGVDDVSPRLNRIRGQIVLRGNRYFILVILYGHHRDSDFLVVTWLDHYRGVFIKFFTYKKGNCACLAAF